MALLCNALMKVKKENILKSFHDIMNNTQSDLIKKREEIKNLLEKDNTIEEVVLGYLLLEKQIMNDGLNTNEDHEKFKSSFKAILLIYESTIEKNTFNSFFKEIYIKKSSLDNLFNFISLIVEYKAQNTIEDKAKIIKRIICFENIKKYNCLMPVSSEDNLELYINILNYHFYENILNSFENNRILDNEENTKLLIKKNYLIIDTQQNNEEKIKLLENIQTIYGTFNLFLLNLSHFLDLVYAKFKKKFFNKKLQSDSEDLNLFEDFMLFLSIYSFKDRALKYVNIWNDSFCDLTLEEKNKIVKMNSNELKHYEIKNNTLLFVKTFSNETITYSINEIDDYSLKPLIDYLGLSFEKPKDIELNRFLKINKYSRKLYIKSIWAHWSTFLIQMYSSPATQSAFSSLFFNKSNKCYTLHHLFIFGEEINLIINNIKYFIFDSDFLGATQGITLSVYMYGDPYMCEDENISKISYLCSNVKLHFHEIIGHLNIRFNYYLYKKKEYLSPKSQNPSSFENDRRGINSGEYVEKMMFGDSNDIGMTIGQMLYILDIKNYNKNLDAFREEFKLYKEKEPYPVDELLNSFLLQLKIDIEKINLNDKHLYKIKRQKSNNVKYNMHPINYKGLDDIYN